MLIQLHTQIEILPISLTHSLSVSRFSSSTDKQWSPRNYNRDADARLGLSRCGRLCRKVPRKAGALRVT